jgi:hypothetical protein
MRICRSWIEAIPGSPYSQSGFLDEVPMLDRESHEDYDARVWREHCTTNGSGQICIPAMAFKQTVDVAAFKTGMKVPGRRGATYRNFFASGFFCNGDVPIANGSALTKADADMTAIWASSTGRRGGSGGSRVKRRYPEFKKWHGVVEFTIVDDIITPDIFEHHLKIAGVIVGIGRFRPENGGTYGRFRVANFEWQEMAV